MSNGAAAPQDPPDDLGRPLPEPVRQRVVGMASDTLGELTAEEVPSALRPFARFAPGRRARLAAIPIAAAVDADADFRARVADRIRTLVPDLAAAVAEGRRPSAVDPMDVAATAYVLRPEGWESVVGEVLDQLERETASLAGERESESLTRLREQVAEARAGVRQERDRRRHELAALKEENATLRRTLRQTRERARAAEEEAARQAELAARAREEAAAEGTRAEAELRRLRTRIADAEAAIEVSRRSAREGRDLASVRLRLLLDTLVDAAQGLRRELALPPTQSRPADSVPAREAAAGGLPSGPEGVVPLETLLTVPQIHLVVDGYNVTKTAWPTLPLETQRTRLVTALGGVAARTGAEVTCVFDGAKLAVPPPLNTPRGVRVRFSPAGISADDVIRQLVAAEPEGRPVVVVSSDREIADGVRRSGARPVASDALVRLLAR